MDTTNLPDNATGTLSDTVQTVTYVYTKNPVKAADVTVKYQDADGNEIHETQTISGNVGEAYDASTDAYKLNIDGYTLDTTNLPDNATGTLRDTAQTVTYIYKKELTPASPVSSTPPNVPDQSAKSSPSSSSISSDSIAKELSVSSELPQTGDNNVRSGIEMMLGIVLAVGTVILTLIKFRRRN